MDHGAESILRPALRGSLHRWSVPVAVALAVWIVVRAEATDVRVGTAVYGGCIVTMLAVSGIYHLPRHSGRLRGALQRVDHSTIVLAIAGSYTAVIIAGMSGTTRVVLLVVTWVIGGVGVAMRLLWFHCPAPVAAVVYLGAGWMALVHPGAYLRALDATELTLLVIGGLLYTLGSFVLMTKRPNPWPSTFGYHEVWHVFVVLAALTHWVALFLLVTS